MFCSNCGKQVGNTEKFCPNCGNPLQTEVKEPKCPGCGADINENEKFYAKCGQKLQNEPAQEEFGVFRKNNASNSNANGNRSKNGSNQPTSSNPFIAFMTEYRRCLPAFIMGIIGSVLGIFGGLCTTVCSYGSASNSAFLMIFGGAVIALIGTCFCLNWTKIGAPLQLFGAILIIARAFSRGAEFMTIFSAVILLASAIIGIIFAFFPDVVKKFLNSKK